MRFFLTGLFLFACLLAACSDDSETDCQPGEQARAGDAWTETSADVVVDTATTADVAEPDVTLDTTDVVATVDTTESEVDTEAENDPDPDRSEP